MNNLHMMKNPWAEGKTTVRCQHCGNSYPARRINCIDAALWPEGRFVLDEGRFFHPVCPRCQTPAEISYPSRYIDRALGVAAVLVPDIENQDADALFVHMNRCLECLAPSQTQYRAVGSFYAMAEQMRIHRHHLNDKAIHLLKPFIIGNLQSQGFEVWNGFFTGLLHPKDGRQQDNTLYFSTQEDTAAAYAEDVYQFNIHLTNGEILPQGINDTAYRIAMDILARKGLTQDDGQFHLYDLSWAIGVHNSLQQN